MTAKAKKPAHSKREERDARDAAWLADHEDNPDPHIYLRDFKCSLLTAKRHLKALDVVCVQGCWQVKGKVLTPEVAAAQARVDHLLDDHVGRREHIQLIDRHTLLIPCEADSCCFADIAKTLRSAWSPIVIMAGWNYRGVDAYVDPDRAEELLNRLRAGKK